MNAGVMMVTARSGLFRLYHSLARLYSLVYKMIMFIYIYISAYIFIPNNIISGGGGLKKVVFSCLITTLFKGSSTFQ